MKPQRSARERLLTPDVLAGLRNLDLVARTAVEGSLIGLHRSAKFGFSQEFAEYRAYAPGDDPRYIDWNVFARTDKTFVKRFYGDTNTQLLVMLDVSASMGVGGNTAGAVDKLSYARFAAAAMLHLASRQHDRAGLLLFADEIVDFQPPRPGMRNVSQLYHRLEAAEARGQTQWASVFETLAPRISGRALVVLISDFYVEPEDLAAGLKKLGVRGHDLLVMHLLAPEDWKPEAGSGRLVKDAETGRTMAVDPADFQGAYQTRLRDHIDQTRRQVLGCGGHYLQMDTDQPLNQTLQRYLNFRARHP